MEKKKQYLPSGSKIAQLIVEKVAEVSVCETDQLNVTTRADKGFGSTDELLTPSVDMERIQQTSQLDIIPFEENELEPATVRSFTSNLDDIYLSCSPYGPTITVKSKITGVHPTIGLKLDDRNTLGRLILLQCESDTPSAKLKK